jgi:hypothetical protein
MDSTKQDQFICWLDGSLTHFEHLPAEQQKSLILEIRTRLEDLQGSDESSQEEDVFLC